MSETSGVLWSHIGRWAERQQVDELIVGKMSAVFDQGGDETRRFRGTGANQYPPSSADRTDGSSRCTDLCSIAILPGGRVTR